LKAKTTDSIAQQGLSSTKSAYYKGLNPYF